MNTHDTAFAPFGHLLSDTDAASCASCRHFALNPHPAEFGACRIGRPRAAEDSRRAAVWPAVNWTDWCGEHHARALPTYALGQGA